MRSDDNSRLGNGWRPRGTAEAADPRRRLGCNAPVAGSPEREKATAQATALRQRWGAATRFPHAMRLTALASIKLAVLAHEDGQRDDVDHAPLDVHNPLRSLCA